MSKSPGSREFDIRLDKRPIQPSRSYRVAVNNYLASGGDGLSKFAAGTNITDRGIIDLDALVAWIGPGRTPPTPNRHSSHRLIAGVASRGCQSAQRRFVETPEFAAMQTLSFALQQVQRLNPDP